MFFKTHEPVKIPYYHLTKLGIGNQKIITLCSFIFSFELKVSRPDASSPSRIYAKRVVCAMGPAYRKKEPIMGLTLSSDLWQVSNRVLQAHQIVPFLTKAKLDSQQGGSNLLENQSILIVDSKAIGSRC